MVSQFESLTKTGIAHVAFVSVNTPTNLPDGKKITSQDVINKAFPKSQDTTCTFIHGDYTERDGSKTHFYVFTMVQAKEVPPATIRIGWEDALKRLKLPWVDKVAVTTLKAMGVPPYKESVPGRKSRKGEGPHRKTLPAVGSMPVLAQAATSRKR